MKKNSASKVRMASLDELLGLPPAPETSGGTGAGNDEAQVVRLPLRILHTYHSHPHGHPFRVRDDEKMAETVESVREYGVLQPGLVRPDKDFPGEYELIAGHRRCRASELAEVEDMPVIIKNLSDAEATVIMADSNLHRDDILPSELAWAYRMKYEALKSMGAQEGTRNDSVLAKEMGKSRATIQRYIRLTYLNEQLLQLVDEGKLGTTPAADLSYLREKEQERLLEVMAELKVIPNVDQAAKLHALSKEGPLNAGVIRLVLEKPEDTSRVSLPSNKVRSYFPESYTGEQIQNIIYRLLEEWQESGRNIV